MPDLQVGVRRSQRVKQNQNPSGVVPTARRGAGRGNGSPIFFIQLSSGVMLTWCLFVILC